MKAKLVKTGNSFLLKDVNDETLAITSGTIQGRMLSLKNCQAIERGYDLDELAREITNKEHLLATQYSKGFEKGIVIGFQKALELMGDKKFSEEDINNAMNWIMTQYFEFYEQPTTGRREHYIQSLQQTEWDVEIEMELNLNGKNAIERSEYVPKLDADGCLILKRI